ncbi:Mo-dependent nitrogenase C-terminal domain-containing protein [Leptothermofonsia sp. ETS-13]|uniref:Mo-dependent nitrogenase C-terminal domain-containing protein n=1 Tax=Leptothermofonsia sp. ETS-13 TaxID=3035696 RepID=UPI003B9F87F8
MSDFVFGKGLYPTQAAKPYPFNFSILNPIRHWLDGLQIDNPKLARFLYKAIPGQCPFERDVILFGRKLAHIPPLCKLNPLYEQLVGLRFRSICYLVDVCGESI